MRKYFYLSIITILLLVLVSTCKTTKVVSNTSPIKIPVQSLDLVANQPTKAEEIPAINYIPVKDSVSVITINLVGDLMCHKPQTNNAEVSAGVYDFRPSFEFVKPYLQNADITIGNLETTFAGTGQPYAGYPAFNSPDSYCEALKDAGFDFLVTANNHSMDTREEGLLRTVDVIKKNKLGYAGTYLNQRDHDSIRILDIKGVKLAVLNYTYGTNGAYPASSRKYMLNVIDSAEITINVKKAREKGADAILVFYHMGVENVAEPIKAQHDAVRFAVDAGANLVIGAHPHVIGPTKMIYSSVIKDSVFVAYSLGNFLSNQYWRYTDAGVILNLELEKNFTKKQLSFKAAKYTPTWVYRGDGGRKMHIVFPADMYSDSLRLPKYLNEGHKQKMQEAFNDTKQVLSKYNQNIGLKVEKR